MLINNPLDMIGDSPLVKLNKLSSKYNSNIYLKLEKYNLTSSSKDRAVKQMIITALEQNIINKDSIIIEPTSGNTGISIAAICSVLNIKCIIVMPSNSNIERINLIKLYGGEVILTDKNKKMKGSIDKAKELLKIIPNSYMLNQFDNIENINAHYIYTANEIIKDLPTIDGFFATYGTAGTLIGTARRLKEYNKNINIISVIPNTKSHYIPGIYSNAKLYNYDTKLVDKTMKIDEVEAFNMIDYLAKNEGITVGISSALAIKGAIEYLKTNKLNNIVIICADGIERYLSNKIIFPNLSKNQIYEDVNKMLELLLNKSIDDEIFLKYRIKKIKLKELIKQIDNDAIFNYQNDPSALSVEQVKQTYPGFYCIILHRIAHILWENNQKEIARIISEYAHSKTGIDIHPACIIGKNFAIDHGSGIVIGETTIIGNNVRIYHNVTLGAKSLNKPNELRSKKRHPTIKNNVIIYAGASILGGSTIIGNNVIIGSNVIITQSIADNKVVMLDNKYIIKEN